MNAHRIVVDDDITYIRSPIGTWHRRHNSDQIVVTVAELEQALDIVLNSVTPVSQDDSHD